MIRLIQCFDDDSVSDMLREYAEAEEICHPYVFSKGAYTANEMYYLDDGGRLVGVVRYTSQLAKPCHGNVGISIRPTERGKGYGTDGIRQILEIAMKQSRSVTACIAEKNDRSIRVFRQCGFVESGTCYVWVQNGVETKAIEFVYRPEE